MKIGILGAGNIGGTLGAKWAKAGHTLQFGVRDANKAEVQRLLKSLGPKASASSLASAVDFAEVVVFAIPGTAMDETITANAKGLDGKIVIDTTNKIGAPLINSQAAFNSHAPQARYYRAFNAYGWENFENPMYGNTPADLFFCGVDGEPRNQVEGLIKDVGMRPIYLGGPEQAGLVDSVLSLWFTLAVRQKMGRNFAFKVLTR
ncbi:MAG: NAD(P)-binding domain-containing protein [Anaerolineaceae bacterium]|nr:NAD(P)-binding domain-containing protein [Anaerolineaceae bacterium]